MYDLPGYSRKNIHNLKTDLIEFMELHEKYVDSIDKFVAPDGTGLFQNSSSTKRVNKSNIDVDVYSDRCNTNLIIMNHDNFIQDIYFNPFDADEISLVIGSRVTQHSREIITLLHQYTEEEAFQMSVVEENWDIYELAMHLKNNCKHGFRIHFDDLYFDEYLSFLRETHLTATR